MMKLSYFRQLTPQLLYNIIVAVSTVAKATNKGDFYARNDENPE